MSSDDTPGIPADKAPAPLADLRNATLVLPPEGETDIHVEAAGHVVLIGVTDYAAAGRVFKWLQGYATGRRKP